MMNKWLFLFGALISVSSYATEYASLKYDKVNLRIGPGERYPILWVYQEKNFPVAVIDTFETWKQVREKDGTVGWVSQNQLKSTRYTLIEKEGNLLKKNDSDSLVLAVVQPGVIAKLEECPPGNYCKVIVSDENNTQKGWFPRSSLWGIDKDELVE